MTPTQHVRERRRTRTLCVEQLESRHVLATVGPAELADLNTGPGHSYADEFTPFAGAIFFIAQQTTGNYKLWKWSDTGTPEVVSANVNDPRELTVVGNKLYFTASTPNHRTQVWQSDGTAAGTKILKIIKAFEGPHSLTAMGGKLYFSAAARLWTSNGTANGTHIVKGTPLWPAGFTTVRKTLYFTTLVGFDLFLWKTNGTAAGTVRLKRLYLPKRGDEASPPEYTPLGNKLLFIARTAKGQEQVWVSNGTPRGTKPITAFAGSPHSLENFQGTVYFVGDGQLWRTNGTHASTVRVTDFTNWTAFGVTSAMGRMFLAGRDEIGFELWTSGGTAATTRRLVDIRPGPEGSNPFSFTSAGGKVFFTADDGVHGRDIWSTDGTEEGTSLVHDFDFQSDLFPTLGAAGGFLYFTYEDAEHGHEIGRLPVGASPVQIGVLGLQPISFNSTSGESSDQAPRAVAPPSVDQSSRRFERHPRVGILSPQNVDAVWSRPFRQEDLQDDDQEVQRRIATLDIGQGRGRPGDSLRIA